MNWVNREPVETDVPALLDLIDEQERALDPEHKPASPSWAIELVRGYVDPPHNRLWSTPDGVIHAWASVQVDEHRSRLEIEMFRRPGFTEMATVWNWCLSLAAKHYSGWTVWPAISSLDTEMAAVFESTSFTLLRRYFFLTRPLNDEHFPELPTGVNISVMTTDDDFREWHAAHQDSFSRHFGFTPRPAEKWIAHNLDADAADPDGRFLLRIDGVVAGFVACSNENAHRNTGYVDLLGVKHEFHHRGFGELLLRWAIAYSAERGFTAVDLAVDTGNESGALALYERVGFARQSEFHVYSRD